MKYSKAIKLFVHVLGTITDRFPSFHNQMIMDWEDYKIECTKENVFSVFMRASCTLYIFVHLNMTIS